MNPLGKLLFVVVCFFFLLLLLAQETGGSSIPSPFLRRITFRQSSSRDDHRDAITNYHQHGRIKPWSRNLHGVQQSSLAILGSGLLRNPAMTRIALLSATILAAQRVASSEAVQRACYFWKEAGPIVAHYKFTQWWLKRTKAPLEKRNEVYKSLHDRYCQPSLDLILHLKGLYVKMGQVMSARMDFMPEQYVDLFSSCLEDSIPQHDWEQTKAVAETALRNEKDLDFDTVFEEINPVAVGCASIGQCHYAVLKDKWLKNDNDDDDNTYQGGKIVAVKIMHPDAKNRFEQDFKVFKWLTRIALPGWRPLLDELQKRLMNEFDYRNEAKNLEDVRDNLQNSPYRNRVCIPSVHRTLSCQHVLVMEFLEGEKLTDAIQNKMTWFFGDANKATEFIQSKKKEVLLGEKTGSSSAHHDISVFGLLRTEGLSGAWKAMKGIYLYRTIHNYINLVVEVHGQQIFRDGVFNADPHMGNLLELGGGKIGLIDYGQTTRLTEDERIKYSRVVSVLGSNGSRAQVAEAMRQAGFSTKEDDDYVLSEYATLFFDSDHEARTTHGYATPQHYFAELMADNPLIELPDSAIMVARASLLFRGTGAALNKQVETAKHWQKHANQALLQEGKVVAS